MTAAKPRDGPIDEADKARLKKSVQMLKAHRNDLFTLGFGSHEESDIAALMKRKRALNAAHRDFSGGPGNSRSNEGESNGELEIKGAGEEVEEGGGVEAGESSDDGIDSDDPHGTKLQTARKSQSNTNTEQPELGSGNLGGKSKEESLVEKELEYKI